MNQSYNPNIKKKRSVFLFGAGASKNWNGPLASELTELICASGFKNKKGQHITQVIYDWLVTTSKLNKEEVNFETIINVIEDFIDFWSKAKSGQINGLAFFTEISNKDTWEELMNFELVEIDKKKYKMEIPSGGLVANDELKTVNYAKYPVPEALYFEMLLKNLFTVIQTKILEYSYLTKSHSKPLDTNHKINGLAISYFKNKQKDSLLRLYALNYDRVFQFLFKKAGIKADELIIIGYSFSDPYINDIIDKAREVNQGLKIEIVDPNINIATFLKNHVAKWKKWKDLFTLYSPKDDIKEIPYFNLTIYKTTFEGYFKIKNV